MNDDVSFCLGCITGNGDVAQDRQFGESGNTVVSFYPIAEEVYQEQDECRNANSQGQGDEEDELAFRTYLSTVGGFIYQYAFVGSCSKLDRVFFSLL